VAQGDSGLRASTAERDATADRLHAHASAGRLTASELGSRLEQVRAAKTRGDLGELLADLPVFRSTPAAFPRLRVSDAERETTVAALRAHHLSGRLNKEEYNERLEIALIARTYEELAHVLSDLPRRAVPVPAPRIAPRPVPARKASNSKAGCGGLAVVLIFLAAVGTVIGLLASNVKQGPTPITGPNSCVAKVTAGADTAYADGDGPEGAAGTGGVIPNPNIPAGYTFPTYVVINDPASFSPADCDEDIAYEGMTKPSSDPLTYLSALPAGLTQACTASGTGIAGSGWYGGMVDVTIYTDNPSDASYIGTSCGYEVNGSTTQLPYEP
jgi:hypothetical protein